MTDHGALYGAIDFYKEARARGIKPIIGIEAYIAPESRHKKSESRSQRLLPPDAAGEGRGGLPQPDPAQHASRTSRASTTSRAWTRSCSPSTARASSPSAAAPPARCTAAERGARRRGAEARGLLPGRVRRLLPRGHEARRAGHQRRVREACCKGLAQLSKKTKIPLVATNDSHYTAPEDHSIHDVLLCIGTNTHRQRPEARS